MSLTIDKNEDSCFSKEMNNIYGLKQKEFILKLEESEKAGDYSGYYSSHIMSAWSNKGNRIGWLVGFNHEADDALYHLLNNKGDERAFKSVDSAVEFLLKTKLVTGANISWC